jgi:acyl-CoA synthetase (AMP-forming)/AMP-acid ligase II
MILSGKATELGVQGDRTTLDDLFRRAGVRHPDMVALADPPNRESFTFGAPRRLTFAKADRAISALAGRLRRLGLQTDMVVALQLPNGVESVVALLGVLRAGMIAVPLPLLWRQQETVAALRMTGAKAIVTSTRIGSTPHAEIAMQVAADVFPIRFVCSFGNDVPDGVMPLDDIFGPAYSDFVQPSVRPGNAAAHIAVVTFDVGTDGVRAIARNHSELIAGGLAPHLESGAPLDAAHLSTIPSGSFAGLALTVMPWLLGGGTLNLHHGFDPDTFAAQCRMQNNGAVVLPGPA